MTSQEIKNLKTKIFSEITTDLTFDEFDKYTFKNPFSLRLSYKGYVLICKTFSAYFIRLDKQYTAGNLIHIGQKIPYPYYLTKEKIILFHEGDAVWLKLKGDLTKWLKSL